MSIPCLWPQARLQLSNWTIPLLATLANLDDRNRQQWFGGSGLRSKEENMRELVRLAEVREGQAKEQMTSLLDNRSNMFQSQNATSEADADLGSIEQQIEEAQRTKALAKKKFSKARSVCIGAHQVTNTA